MSGGVYMNMVTQSGGNQFKGDYGVLFMNDKLQGDNVDDELRKRLNLPPGAPAAAAGNPIDKSYDWSATLGGPILRDKVVVLQLVPLVPARSVPDRRGQPRRFAGDRRQPHPGRHGQGHLPGVSKREILVPDDPPPQGAVPSPQRALPLDSGQGDGATTPWTPTASSRSTTGCSAKRCWSTSASAGSGAPSPTTINPRSARTTSRSTTRCASPGSTPRPTTRTTRTIATS